MHRTGVVTVIVVLSAIAGPARGDFIVSIDAGTGTTVLGLPPSSTDLGALTLRDFTSPSPLSPSSAFPAGTQVNNDNTSLGLTNPNQARINLDVFALHQAFDVVVTTQPATSVPPSTDSIGAAEYFFVVNLRNMLNLNGVDPNNASHVITGFDVEIVPTSGPDLGVNFDDPSNDPIPTGGPMAFLNPLGRLSPTLLRFGGISGGGPGIAFGDTATLTFSVDIPGGTSINPPSRFALRFTANPEPGSLALAGLALAAGGWLTRRRKRQHPSDSGV